MQLIAILLLLMHLEVRDSNSVAASSLRSSAFVYNVTITDGCHIILMEGSNPCLHISSCFASNGSTQCCISNSDGMNFTLNEVNDILLHELLSSPSGLSKLVITKSFFLGCSLPSHNECHAPSYQNMIKFQREKFLEVLLEILENSFSNKNDDILHTFEASIHSLKLSNEESLYLYYRAYALKQNSPLIVNKFGQILAYMNRNDLSITLYETGVKNGLWPHRMQRPEWTYIQGLTSKPWHSSSDLSFSWLLEKHYSMIKDELNYFLENQSNSFVTEKWNLNAFKGGDWTTLALKTSPGKKAYTAMASHFQETVQIISETDEDFLEVKFSALKPGTHILPHTGPSNNRLRVHLCLFHTGGALLRVGDEWRTWKEGKILVFDSSWEHEVIHTGKDVRIVLILDIWHPECPNDMKKI